MSKVTIVKQVKYPPAFSAADVVVYQEEHGQWVAEARDDYRETLDIAYHDTRDDAMKDAGLMASDWM